MDNLEQSQQPRNPNDIKNLKPLGIAVLIIALVSFAYRDVALLGIILAAIGLYVYRNEKGLNWKICIMGFILFIIDILTSVAVLIGSSL